MAIAKNKKAYFDYEILETYEAGIELRGYEVKSIKLGRISLKGSYVTTKNGELYLTNAHISPYQTANMPKDYNPARPRKLLMKHSQIAGFIGKSKSEGLTLVPVSVYTKKGKIKVEVAVARGKKQHEKREKIRKRDIEREIGRNLR